MTQTLRHSLLTMQGHLFELSGLKGYDSKIFIETFMKSSIVKGLDRDFDYMQWDGNEYSMELVSLDNKYVKKGDLYV